MIGDIERAFDTAIDYLVIPLVLTVASPLWGPFYIWRKIANRLHERR